MCMWRFCLRSFSSPSVKKTREGRIYGLEIGYNSSFENEGEKRHGCLRRKEKI